MPPTVAIIGSFKQHYKPVLDVWSLFRSRGYVITSPKGDPVIEEGIPFVRFTSDPVAEDDAAVQTIALHRILRADFVYVVAPGGYVGRTTCYEIGRIIQAGRPIYFSAQPNDLPLCIPPQRIRTAQEIAEGLADGTLRLERLFSCPIDGYGESEEDLFLGRWHVE
jgi:hypothetical protein